MKKADSETLSPPKKIEVMAVLKLRFKELPEGFEADSRRENEVSVRLPNVGEFTRPALRFEKKAALLALSGEGRMVLSEDARGNLDGFWLSILDNNILRKCRPLTGVFPGWVITNIIVCDKTKYRPGIDFSSLDGREYFNLEILLKP